MILKQELLFPSLLSGAFHVLTGCARCTLGVEVHITQQVCAFHFFLSIKVISESSQALLCQKRGVKRGEIDGRAVRASHQEKVRLRVCAAGRNNSPRQSQGSRQPHVKLTETTAICCSA